MTSSGIYADLDEVGRQPFKVQFRSEDSTTQGPCQCQWSLKSRLLPARGSIWMGRSHGSPSTHWQNIQVLAFQLYFPTPRTCCVLKKLLPRLYCLFSDKNMEWKMLKNLLVTQDGGLWHVLVCTLPKCLL